MSERETHDFMSVDSFSQLPFIRRSPAKERPAASNAAIRLFGFDVPQKPDGHTSEDVASKDSTTNNNSSNNNNNNSSCNESGGTGGGTNGGGESGRKFECHYCCRNFPTSQALGGHQNAHKRERQHAKRVHFQSTMAAHNHHTGVSEGPYGYGILGYHHLTSVPSAARFSIGHAFEPVPPSHYPSWNSASNATGPGRFNGGLGSVSQPINGSPLPGIWRVPASMQGSASIGLIRRDRSMPLPLLAGHDSRVMGMGIGASGAGVGSSSSSSSSSTSPRHPYESMHGVKDSVSLDLHL